MGSNPTFSAMSFFFDDVAPDFRCKECGSEITIDQYRRLMYCDECQRVYDRLTHGEVMYTQAEIDRKVAELCPENWDIDFLRKLDAWQEKKKHLR